MGYRQIRKPANLFAVYNTDGTLNRFIDRQGNTITIPFQPGGGGGGETTIPVSAADFGPQTFVPTDTGEGAFWVGPTDSGLGDGSSYADAKQLTQAVLDANLTAGGVMFVKGGTYAVGNAGFKFNNGGDALNPLIFEGVNGESAIFDGVGQADGKFGAMQIQTGSDFVQLRNFEVTDCPWSQVYITASDCTLDNLLVNDGRWKGVQLAKSGGATARNRLVNCTLKNNSDFGRTTTFYNDGGNGDGLSISGGTDTIVEYCTADGNSDDGFDTFGGVNTIFRYLISKNHTGPGNGEGKGLKMGGGSGTTLTNNLAEFCLVYGNVAGMNSNGGKGITFRNITCWNQSTTDRWFTNDTIVQNCIATTAGFFAQRGIEENNSWQRNGTVAFISTLEANPDFLKPTVGGGFDDIGALIEAASGP